PTLEAVAAAAATAAVAVVPVDEADIPTPPPRVNGASGSGAPAAIEAPPAEAEPTLHDQASRLRGAEMMLTEPAADQATPPPDAGAAGAAGAAPFHEM